MFQSIRFGVHVLAVFLRILTVFLIFAAGFALRRGGKVDDAFCRQLSVVLMTVFYPCLILNTITLKLTLPELLGLWRLPVGAGLVMGVGWIVGWFFCRVRGTWPDAQRRTAQYLCLMNNYSFLPLMLAASLWGKRGEALVVLSTLGPELMVWTLGVQAFSGSRMQWRSLRSLFSMPLGAIVVALLVLCLETLLPGSPLPARTTPFGSLCREVGDMLLYTCGLAGQGTIPVSAILAGIRMGAMRPHHLVSLRVLAITVLRLLVIPGLAILALIVLPLDAEIRGVLFVIATMPAALTSVPMATLYGGDGEFAAAAVFVSHVACLATIPLWLALVGIGTG